MSYLDKLQAMPLVRADSRLDAAHRRGQIDAQRYLKQSAAEADATIAQLVEALEEALTMFLERQPAKGLDGEAQAMVDNARAAIKAAKGEA